MRVKPVVVDGDQTTKGRWPDAVAVAGLLLLAMVYGWMRVIRDPDYFKGDIVTQFLPYYSVVGERLRAGDIPGWNPALFSGMPLAGDPISGWGYLPVMAIFPFLSPLTAYQVFVVAHLAGAALAGYFLGRVLGMGPIGAFTTGAAYLLGPQFGYAQCCTARMQIVPWVAIAMAGVVLVARAKSMRGRVLWWGVSGLAIAQMIAGYFGKGFYYGIIAVCALLAYQVLLESHGAIWRRCGWLAVHTAAVLGIGLGLSAMTLLPRLTFLARSNLQGGSYEAAGEGAAISPAWPLEQVIETVLDSRSPTYYLGAIVLVLSFAAIPLAGRAYAAPFFALYAITVLILAGERTPVHLVFYLIPKFQTLHEHHPHRILTLLTIAPAVLIGCVVSAIEQGLATSRRLLLACLAICAGAIPLVLVAHKGNTVDMTGTGAVIDAVLVLLVLAGAFALNRRFRIIDQPRAEVLAAVLLAFLLVRGIDAGRGTGAVQSGWSSPPTGAIGTAYADSADTGGAGQFLRDRLAAGEWFRYYGYDAAYLEMHRGGGGRNYRLQWRNLDAEALLVNNRALVLELNDIQGYTPAHVLAYVQWMDMANGQSQEYHEADVLPTGLFSPLVDLLGARYVIVPADVPPGRPDLLHLSQRYPTVYVDSTVRVLENANALPRAWVVRSASPATFNQAMSRLAIGLVDPLETVLLDPGVPFGEMNFPTTTATGTVAITRFEPDLIRYQVEMETAGYLVIGETWDPDWRATVDGAPATLLRANGILRAVALPAGVHEIELTYESPSLRQGLWISGLVAALWVVMLVCASWYDRRRTGPGVKAPGGQAPCSGELPGESA